jgi:hypothetical protein
LSVFVDCRPNINKISAKKLKKLPQFGCSLLPPAKEKQLARYFASLEDKTREEISIDL